MSKYIMEHNTNTTSTQVLIIGGGPAGIFSAFICGMLGIEAILLDAMGKLGGQCAEIYPEKPIYDIPGFFEIKGKDLIARLESQMNRFSYITTMLSTKLKDLNHTAEHFISTTTNGIIRAKNIILSTGMGRLIPNKPKLDNLSTLENAGFIKYFMDDLEKFKGKTVVILGGGDSAGDWCVNLSKIANKVYLIHRRAQLRTIKSIQREIDSQDNCNLILSAELKGITQQNEQVRVGYTINNTNEAILADYVVPCYGMQTVQNFVNHIDISMDNQNRIKTNPTTAESSINGIYAVGDAASYENKNYLITCGFAEAANAVYHIARKLSPQAVIGYSTSIFNKD